MASESPSPEVADLPRRPQVRRGSRLHTGFIDLSRRPNARVATYPMTAQEFALARDEAVCAAGVAPQSSSATEAAFGCLWQYRHVYLAVADATIVVAAFLACYWLRFFIDSFSFQQTAIPDVALYVRSAAILAGAWLFGLWRDGAYEPGLRGVSAPTLRLRAILTSGVYAVCALMAVGFMYRDLLLSRQVYLMSAVVAVLAMSGTRTLFGAIDCYLARRGFATRVLIVGLNRTAFEFADAVDRASSARVCGFVSSGEPFVLDAPRAVLGYLGDLEAIHARVPFNMIVVACQGLVANGMDGDNERIVELLNFCEENNIALYMVPGSFDVAVSPREIATFSGTPLINLKDASLHPLYAITKRIIDVACACAILLAGLPLWLFIIVAIKLTSPGPLLFMQWRAGRHGRPFKMYKFRSMAVDAEAQLARLMDVNALAEPVFKIRNDPRVTPFGRWLRSSGLDEIPQLLNVLRGDMSIVGPRPEEVGLVSRYDPWQRRRLKAKPGITGYQQISNRGGTSLAERVKYDLVYLKHQSFLLDLYILLRTPVVILKASGITH